MTDLSELRERQRQKDAALKAVAAEIFYSDRPLSTERARKLVKDVKRARAMEADDDRG